MVGRLLKALEVPQKLNKKMPVQPVIAMFMLLWAVLGSRFFIIHARQCSGQIVGVGTKRVGLRFLPKLFGTHVVKGKNIILVSAADMYGLPWINTHLS